MMRAPWLGDVLTDAGLTVATPVGDPIGRGRDMDTIYGVVAHDTVTPGWDDLRVARLLRDGRPKVPGPLSQLGVRTDGTVDWIADGRCNHNGYGLWGNDAIGIEVYCGGGYDRANPDPWNDRQRAAVVAGARAILDHLRLSPSAHWNPRVAGHKETDPARKIDPYDVDMDAVRADVERGRTVTRARIGGATWFDTVADIMRTRYRPGDTDVMYVVVRGTTEASRAAHLGAPVAECTPGGVPGPTMELIRHFRPTQMVALGGPEAVPEAVLSRCVRIAERAQ